MESKIPFEYWRTLNIIYYALMGGVVLFSFVVYFLITTEIEITGDPNLNQIFLIGSPLFLAVSYFVGNMVANNVLTRAGNQDRFDKQSIFQTAMIIRGASLEAPAIFSIIGVLITGEIKLFAFTFLALAVMYLKRPTKEAFVDYLDGKS